MPQQFGNLVKKLLEKAGLNAADAKYADVLSINGTIGDEAFNDMSNFLDGALTLDAAKNDSRLDAHFKSKALLPADSEIARLLEELGFDDVIKGEFTAEKSTYKKIGLLANKVKELEAKKATAGTGDKKALSEEITILNNQILAINKERDDKVKAAEESANQRILDYAVNAELGNKNYADNIPAAIRVSGAKDLLVKELSAKGIKVVHTADNKLKLVKSDNPDLSYMDNNKEVSFGDFVDKLLGTHTMLKVSGQPPAPRKGTTDKTVDVSSITDFNQEQIAKLEGSST
jgi:hypothetical protein